MNPRERILAIVLVTAIVVGGGVFGVGFVYLPKLNDKKQELNALQNRVSDKEATVFKMQQDQVTLDKLRQISLPPDPVEKPQPGAKQVATAAAKPQELAANKAQGDYQNFLTDLVAASKFAPGGFNVVPRKLEIAAGNQAARGKKPAFVKLSYTITGHGTLVNLVDFMHKFYEKPLLHQIKSVVIHVPETNRQDQNQRPDELDLTVEVEALVVDGAKPRDVLLAKDAPPAKVLSPDKERDYAKLTQKNIFFGNRAMDTGPRSTPPAEITQYVRLTTIWENVTDHKLEAWFRDLAAANPDLEVRMRVEPGFDKFVIRDAKGDIMVEGFVARIDQPGREVIFRVGEKFYRVHMGESVLSSMRRELSESEVKTLGLVKETPTQKTSAPTEKKDSEDKD